MAQMCHLWLVQHTHTPEILPMEARGIEREAQGAGYCPQKPRVMATEGLLWPSLPPSGVLWGSLRLHRTLTLSTSLEGATTCQPAPAATCVSLLPVTTLKIKTPQFLGCQVRWGQGNVPCEHEHNEPRSGTDHLPGGSCPSHRGQHPRPPGRSWSTDLQLGLPVPSPSLNTAS